MSENNQNVLLVNSFKYYFFDTFLFLDIYFDSLTSPDEVFEFCTFFKDGFKSEFK